MADGAPLFPPGGRAVDQTSGAPTDLATLFHRLNNQLGIILANAELLEHKLEEAHGRVRAGQILSSAIDAISTAQDIRIQTHDPRA